MNSLKKIYRTLSIPEQSVNYRQLLLLILFAYLFSVVIRMIWVYQFSGLDGFMWNGEIMINTNDGYAWAEGARDILRGQKGFEESPVNEPVSILTAWMYHILPLSFDSLILYMPTIFGSLLVIPILFIGVSLRQPYIGFAAALFGGIVWSYYNRTMTGYYDTDLLVVVLPTFMTWSIIHVVHRRDWNFIWLPAVSVILAWLWHGGGGHIATGMIGLLFAYFILFAREDKLLMTLMALLLISISFTATTFLPLKIAAIALVVFFSIKCREYEAKYFVLLLIGGIAIYLVSGGWNNIMTILRNSYILRADTFDVSLQYYAVVNTVREAGHIPFDLFANRISGHTWTFFLSCIGYVLMVVRYPVMILSLPMVVLGFFALQGGLRFTVFSVPFMALGLVYLFFWAVKQLHLYARIGLITVALALALYPNIAHVLEYKVPTVFDKKEVEVLDRFKDIATPNDYVITWWDYGYPIRYYSNTKTLVDGGKHSGEHNFPISYMLSTDSPLAAANMGRFVVEYTQSKYDLTKKRANIAAMMKDYGFADPDAFLDALKDPGLKPPEATRDVYYYFPNRMLEIFPTVGLFSNLDLHTGKQKPRPLYYYTKSYSSNDGRLIDLGGNIRFDIAEGIVEIGQQKVQVNQYIETVYQKQGKMEKQVYTVNPNSPLYVIFMKSFNAFLVLEKKMFESLYIQMFILDNYDPGLFEPVLLDPLTKIYKLKR